jgi:glycosyltransferase involved in cell wall biosynthesis
LLFVGRLTAQKGLTQLMQMAPDILSRLPEHQLVLLGQGPLESALKNQVASCQCRDRIHFLGWRPNPWDYMKASQIVLLNSRWEGQPNAILEAMSLAKPFVSTDVHGISDIFQAKHSERIQSADSPPSAEINGQLAQTRQVVPLGNSAAYVHAVVTMAKEPEIAKKIGTWNRNHVEKHFSQAQFLAAHEQVFLKLARPCQHGK